MVTAAETHRRRSALQVTIRARFAPGTHFDSLSKRSLRRECLSRTLLVFDSVTSC